MNFIFILLFVYIRYLAKGLSAKFRSHRGSCLVLFFIPGRMSGYKNMASKYFLFFFFLLSSFVFSSEIKILLSEEDGFFAMKGLFPPRSGKLGLEAISFNFASSVPALVNTSDARFSLFLLQSESAEIFVAANPFCDFASLRFPKILRAIRSEFLEVQHLSFLPLAIFSGVAVPSVVLFVPARTDYQWLTDKIQRVIFEIFHEVHTQKSSLFSDKMAVNPQRSLTTAFSLPQSENLSPVKKSIQTSSVFATDLSSQASSGSFFLSKTEKRFLPEDSLASSLANAVVRTAEKNILLGGISGGSQGSAKWESSEFDFFSTGISVEGTQTLTTEFTKEDYLRLYGEGETHALTSMKKEVMEDWLSKFRKGSSSGQGVSTAPLKKNQNGWLFE